MAEKRRHAMNPVRRALLAGSAAALAAVEAKAQPAAPRRHTFVLVHGASQGGWCWRRVADRLERRGHKVFTPTLTGLGERSHLMSREVDLEMHITDIDAPRPVGGPAWPGALVVGGVTADAPAGVASVAAVCWIRFVRSGVPVSPASTCA